MIEIKEIHAANNRDLREELNKIEGKVISIQPLPDDWYKVIFEVAETKNKEK